jgi:diguanylate cyclase (GGDEF)-like protein
MSHVIVLNAEQSRGGPALIDALRESGVGARASHGAANGNGGAPRGDATAGRPLAVLYEVADGADVRELLAAVERAASEWPRVPLVACRGCEPGPARDARRPDAAVLLRLGFSAVADDPAQLPALLREIEAGVAADAVEASLHTSEVESENSPPASLLLPEGLSPAQLRAAFEAVAALHFVGDQQSAAHAALAGLAPLVRAHAWALYLAESEPDGRGARFEPLAARGLPESQRESSPGDPPPALRADTLMSLVGAESEAVREAGARAERVRGSEGGRRLLAVPLVCGGRVHGVIEAAREGAAAPEFSDGEAAVLSALSVPVAAALANSVRIAEAERLSLTDDLTKLHNARFLRQHVTAEVKRARRYGSAASSLFIDIDDFKEINDRHGHLVGSHVLMEVASVILTGVRDTDVVARYGGDEFVVVLPEAATGMALRVAERVREKIAFHQFTGGRALCLRLTASIGVACFPEHAQSPQQLIAAADAAMYEAKAARKNCVRAAPELAR